MFLFVNDIKSIDAEMEQQWLLGNGGAGGVFEGSNLVVVVVVVVAALRWRLWKKEAARGAAKSWKLTHTHTHAQTDQQLFRK